MRKTDLPSPETVAKFTKSVTEPLPEKLQKKWLLKNLEAGLTARGTKRKNKV